MQLGKCETLTTTDPLRLLHIILDGFPTFRPDVVALWGKYLPAEGVTSDLVTMENYHDGPLPPWGGGRLFICSRPSRRMFEPFRAFFHELKVMMSVRRGQYDALQVRDKAFICIPAFLYARMFGIPFFYWMSFPIAESLARLAATLDRRRQFARWVFLWIRGHVGAFVLYRLILPRADHVFVQSDRMLEDLAALGIDRDRMTAVPMCIDPKRFPEPLRLERPSGLNGRPVVGYLGECSRIRRIDFLFEAISIVRKRIPDIYLLVVGDAIDPEDQAWLRSRVRELELEDNVRITGWVKAEEVPALFASVDIGLALMAPDPILDSTTPTKLVEYLAMGRPVVANDHPDQSLVLQRSGGGIAVPFEANAFGHAIVTLLGDAARRDEMASRGREWVFAERSYPKMAQRLAYIYLQQLRKIENRKASKR